MSNRQRKRLNELDRMSSSQLKEKLAETENKIREVRTTMSWGFRKGEEATQYRVPKGVGRERRRLKAALKRAEERENQPVITKKKDPNAPNVNPDTAMFGAVVKEFVDRGMFIEKGDDGFIIRRKLHGDTIQIGNADSYKEAVKEADRLFERMRQRAIMSTEYY